MCSYLQMSDPIDAILADTVLLAIIILIILIVVGSFMWVFRVSMTDRMYKKRYIERKENRMPRMRMPELKYKKKQRINPRYTYVGPKGIWNVFVDSKTGKTIYRNRKTGERKDKKIDGVMV